MNKYFLSTTTHVFLSITIFIACQSARAATTDSVAFTKGHFVVTKSTDASGWIYHCADTAAQTYFEVHQTGGILTKLVACLHGIHYSIINEANGIFKMMPWPNRTAGGKFTDANGVIQNLLATPLMTQTDGLGNAIHGMVSGRPWQVSDVDADSEGVYIHCYFDTQGWPVISGIFGEFRDHTIYRLNGNILIIDAYTENNSSSVFSDCGWGFHPWINAPVLPLEGTQNGTRARCSILMPADSIAIVNSAKIPTGEIQHVASYLNDSLDFNSLKKLSSVNADNFFTGLKPLQDIGFTRSLYIDFGNRVRLQLFGQYPFYPWMVIYTPAGMVCMEHQTEEVNGLNTKQHLISIGTNGTSPRGRVIFAVDDDTTTAYAPITSLHQRVSSHESTMPLPGRVSFSGSRISLCLEKSDVRVSCTVYTLGGKLVAHSEVCFGQPGTYSIDLTNTDMAGRHVAKGIYVATVSAGAFRATGLLARP
jgi:galactose mutarotase-like enzyme